MALIAIWSVFGRKEPESGPEGPVRVLDAPKTLQIATFEAMIFRFLGLRRVVGPILAEARCFGIALLLTPCQKTNYRRQDRRSLGVHDLMPCLRILSHCCSFSAPRDDVRRLRAP